MPIIAIFCGIIVRMYFLQSEHNPPHVHAIYQDRAAAIAIGDLRVLDGGLPPDKLHEVRRWIARYQCELSQMWHTQQFMRLPSLPR